MNLNPDKTDFQSQEHSSPADEGSHNAADACCLAAAAAAVAVAAVAACADALTPRWQWRWQMLWPSLQQLHWQQHLAPLKVAESLMCPAGYSQVCWGLVGSHCNNNNNKKRYSISTTRKRRASHNTNVLHQYYQVWVGSCNTKALLS